jgi:hypothetical protein
MASMCLIMLSIVFDRHILGYHMAVVAGEGSLRTLCARLKILI